METTRYPRAVTLAATAFLVAALAALLVPAALAAPTAAQLQRAHGGAVASSSTPVTPVHGLTVRGPFGGRGLVGRGRSAVAPVAAAPTGAAWVAGGILAVLIVAGSATWAVYATRRSRAAGATVTSIGAQPAGGEASPEESRREAA